MDASVRLRFARASGTRTVGGCNGIGLAARAPVDATEGKESSTATEAEG
jgi:hypothetical protein